LGDSGGKCKDSNPFQLFLPIHETTLLFPLIKGDAEGRGILDCRGHNSKIHNITWQEFEQILQELGDHRGSRLAYENGTLEIMTPLP
jgi:hypothetical protein